MIFHPVGVDGAFLIEPEPHGDERGRFSRVWCAREFADHGITATWEQANSGFSVRRWTLRGLHVQLPPASEAKLVRCTRGSIFDVIVDVRDESPTRFRWFGVEIGEDDARSVYIPEGCAHGYLTLRDASEVSYLTSAAYAPASERGVHYADPLIGIEWPGTPQVISHRDANWPMLDPTRTGRDWP